MKSSKAGPVCVPPPSHCHYTAGHLCDSAGQLRKGARGTASFHLSPGSSAKGQQRARRGVESCRPAYRDTTGAFALLLDIGGTAFQKRVWKALREIPAGQTATYNELALKLGATTQEIGEACAANALTVVVPCHRVIRSDGRLAGYRWGVNRKRLLLQREQEMFPDPQSLFAMPALMKGHAPLKSSS